MLLIIFVPPAPKRTGLELKTSLSVSWEGADCALLLSCVPIVSSGGAGFHGSSPSSSYFKAGTTLPIASSLLGPAHEDKCLSSCGPSSITWLSDLDFRYLKIRVVALC